MITPEKLIQLASAKPGKIAITGAAIAAAAIVVFVFIPPGLARWVALGFLAFVVGLILLIRFLFQRKIKGGGKAMQQAMEAEQQHALSVAPAEERARVEEIRRRFQEAVDELRRAGRSVYDLPWYLLIGEPQSGKSMTLRGSELHFPVGTDKLSGLGGTRNCDWWFTNEAVILDTAGRFTFQDAGAPDKAEWEGFLRLLGKRRRHCPINGVIVVIPTDALLNDSAETRREKAKNIQLKLGELQRELGVQFPVFVLITKCDLVLGFSEFFRSFGDVQAAQLIGWSTEAPFNKPYDESTFESAFQGIYQKLAKQRLDVLRKPASLDERGLAFSFPEEFKALGVPLQRYFRAMFAQDIYHDPLFFRGFYFTSGVQMGEPIAKAWREVMGAGAAPGQKEFDSLGSLFPPRPFFIADFYKKKALREKGLVFRSEAEIRRGRTLRKWTWAFVGVAGAVLLAFVTIGGIQVRRLLTEPMRHAERADTLIKDTGRPIGREDLSALYSGLSTDAENLGRRGFWFRMMTAFHGGRAPAAHLIALRDALFMRRELHPLTIKLEQKLAGPWAEERGRQYSESLKEYVAWWTGHSPNSETAENSFHQMYAPVWDEVPPGVQETFRSLGDFSLLGSQAMSVEPLEGGNLHRAIQSARQYYLGYANGELDCEECELAHWRRLHQGCNAFEQRRGELIGLAPEFAAVEDIAQYNQAAKNWYAAYEAPPSPDQPLSFSAAVAQIRLRLTRLPKKTLVGDAKPEEFEPPDFSRVRGFWWDFFRHATNDNIPTLSRMVDNARRLQEGTRERVSGWLRGATDDLDRVADAAIKDTKTTHDNYGRWLYKVADLQPNAVSLVDKLAAIAAHLTQPRKATVTGDLANWESVFNSLRPKPRAEEAPAATNSEADARWQWRRVADLQRDVQQAASRHTWYVESNRALEFLTQEIELLHADAKWVNEVDAGISGFAAVPRRWSATYLRTVVNRVEDIQDLLRTAKESRWSLLEVQSAELSSTDLNPSARLLGALETRLAEYASRYFDAWCGYYRATKIVSYDTLIDSEDWEGYCTLLTDAESKDDFQSSANVLLGAFIQNVLSVETGGLGDTSNDRTSWTPDHKNLIHGARVNTRVCGKAFAEAHKHATTLASAANDAFSAFRKRVRALGPKLDRVKSEATEDLAIKELDDLRSDIPDERFGKQLYNIAQRGRYLLNVKLDSTLLAKIGADMRAEFPFLVPVGGAELTQMTEDGFRGFMINVMGFERQFGKIQEIETKAFRPDEVRVGRTEYLRRVKEWRAFLYGAQEDSKPQIVLSPHNLTAKNVYFSVQYKESSKADSISAAAAYSRAVLGLGGAADDVNKLDSGPRREYEVNLTTPDEKPKKLGWKFGWESSTSLQLRSPTGLSGLKHEYDVPEAKLDETIWALPLFIYRFRDPAEPGEVSSQTEGDLPPRAVWPVQIPFELQGKRYHIQFTITIDKCGNARCGLPEPIGWFSPSTEPPQLLPLD